MNKNRGIWLVIGGILVVGILVTFATSNFVKNRESFSGTAGSAMTPVTEMQETAAEADSGPAPQLFSADAGTSGETSETAPDEEILEKSGAAFSQETVLSPIDPDGKNSAYTGTDASKGAAFYRERLEELDMQIKKMWEESGNSNTYSMKALADKELKLWNRAQTEIYTAVSDGLDGEARQALEDSQQVWIKSRDAKAEEDSQKYSGGSLEELEYTMSLAASTKARAYELVDGYLK